MEAQIKGSFLRAQGSCGNHRIEKARWRRIIAVFGAERIRGELLKLGVHVCKRTIQKYIKNVRTPQPRGQKWATDLEQSRGRYLGLRRAFWSQISSFDRSLRSSSSNGRSRKVIHVGVTRSPTDPWVAQQLREATPYGQAPKYLIRENESKFGPCFARVATTSDIEILKTPFHAKRPNAICERFMRSVRQECLDHLLIFHEKQLQRVRNRVCGILQSGTSASRDSAADSRIVWII